jgi:hypothetical protein
MRVTIEFIVHGTDLADVTNKARDEWRRIMNNQNEELPTLAEMKLRSNEIGDELIGYVTMNTKLED